MNKLIFAAFCLLKVSRCSQDAEITYEQLYKFGKNSYTVENWVDCVAYMKRALGDYHFYRDEQYWCRKKCLMLLPELSEDDGPQIEIAVFHRFGERALCLLRCKLDQYGSLRPQKSPDDNIEQEFRLRRPYHYLQFCHWKLNDIANAVQSAYTFLVGNPGDQTTTENLRYYATLEGYSPNSVIDLEQKKYQKLYLEGVEMYEDEDWIGAIDKFERALENYWEEEERCKLDCFSAVDFDVFDGPPEFFVTITSQQAAVLRCKVACATTIGVINGNAITNFMPSHYNYLQFAYYKVNRGRNACESVANYLLFVPDDETMLANEQFYRETLNVGEELFVPSQKAIEYYETLVLERRALAFIDEKFRFVDDLLVHETVDDRKPFVTEVPEIDKYMSKKKEETKPLEKEHSKSDETADAVDIPSEEWEPPVSEIKELSRAKKLHLVKKERELHGDLRFFAENFLSSEECGILLQLQPLTEAGNGYNGRSNPHTHRELFSGLTLRRIVQLVESGKVAVETAKLLLDKSELARQFVQTYFNLTSTLFFDFTHLVCRTAKDSGERENGADDGWGFSHPVHGDNCVVEEDGCVKRSPAYVWRDYSAIIYLNGREMFTGGNFVFTDNQKRIQTSLEPGCGRMIGFSGETLHGVLAINNGTRCALAMWLTLDETHRERDRIDAQQRLAQFELTNSLSFTSQSESSTNIM